MQNSNPNHPSLPEAQAILMLAASPQWPLLEQYLKRRLELWRDGLESGLAPETNRGRCHELRDLIALPKTAETILESQRR